MLMCCHKIDIELKTQRLLLTYMENLGEILRNMIFGYQNSKWPPLYQDGHQKNENHIFFIII